jgi:uncharacterized protein HemY
MILKDNDEFADAIELFKIANSQTPRAHICKHLSECYINVYKYVEATQQLSLAADLQRSTEASVGGWQFFEVIERYYRDLDIKFW